MERVGGVLCLDFLNTVDAWPSPTRDDLVGSEDLQAWAADGGTPLQRPATAADVAAARVLRGHLLELFTAVVAGQAVAGGGVLWLLARSGASAAAPVRALTGAGHVELAWPSPTTPSDLLSAVAWSAVCLLVRGPLQRVRACAACGWFFLDSSRNGTRRWCSMQVCGSRAKARAYSGRQRRSAAGEPGPVA